MHSSKAEAPPGVDNDILLKGGAYGLLPELLASIPARLDQIGILGSAIYVVPSRLRKIALSEGGQQKISKIEAEISQAIILEPDDEDLKLAAEFEFVAQRNGISLDTGESQLFAMLARDRLVKVATGDKRAVAALSAVLTYRRTPDLILQRLICLEQLALRALLAGPHAALRAAVCAEPDVDKSLAICFLCCVPSSEIAEIRFGLQSYIADLRARTGKLLEPD